MANISERVQGKVTIVTGAAGGIGQAICRQLVAAGGRVVCADIDYPAVKELADSLGPEAIAQHCDVSLELDAGKASQAAIEKFGALHALVNNAAAFIADGTIENISLSDWSRALQVNLTGAMLMSKFAIPHLRRQGGGSIVNMASQLGHVGKAGRSWYCAAKGGLINFTKALAIDHARDGIRVNSVSPGPIATDRIVKRAGGPEAIRTFYADLLLTPGPGTPDNVAHAVVYLVSDESAYMTGSDLLMDGGYTAV